jgi:hypothetical protein
MVRAQPVAAPDRAYNEWSSGSFTTTAIVGTGSSQCGVSTADKGSVARLRAGSARGMACHQSRSTV